MTRIHLLASIGLGLLFSPLAAAQTIETFDGEEHRESWPTEFQVAGPFGRGIPGLFTQGLARDAVLLRGMTPFLLARPAEFFATTSFPVQAHDLATLPGGAPGASGVTGGTGTRDAVVFVGPAGATLGWFDEDSGTVVTKLLTAAPSGARLVRVGDLDADGDQDFVVVEADGITVTSYLADGLGGFTAGISFSTVSPCQNLVVVRWDADPELELALLTDLGVELFDDDGTQQTSWSAVLPGGALCAFSQVGSSTDRLLWITAYAPPADQFMMTLSPGGVDDLINLGALDAFAVVATDADLDGFDDVLVSHKYSHELLRFENQRTAANPTGPSFPSNGTDMLTFDVGPPDSGAPENEAWPIVADFDGDGDDDIVFPSELEQELAVLRGEQVDQAGQFVALAAGSFEIDPATQAGVLHLSLTAPALLPAGASALEVEVWRRPDLSGPLDAVSTEHLLVPLTGTWPLDVDVPLPESASQFSACYYLQLRLVTEDAAGQVATRFPTTVFAYAATAANAALLALSEEVTGEPETTIPDDEVTEGKARRTQVLPELPPGQLPSGSLIMF